MAADEFASISAELNKLKKSDLIELIVTSSLPDTCTSDILISYASTRAKKCNCEDISFMNDSNTTVMSTNVNTVLKHKDFLVKNEVKHLKELSEQKDKVIANQSLAIETLKNHNNLLNALLNSNNNINKDFTKVATSNDNIQNVSRISTTSQIPKNQVQITPKPSCSDNTPSGRRKPKPMQQASHLVTTQQVSSAVHQATAVVKTDEVLALRDDNKIKESNWNLVQYKKRTRNRTIMVGTGSAGDAGTHHPIRAVSSLSYFHLFKLHPNTSHDDVIKFLKPQFSEVTCEKLNSRYPDEYSSFKVGVYEKNVDSFLEPSRWAEGTRINKFFHKKIGENTQT